MTVKIHEKKNINLLPTLDHVYFKIRLPELDKEITYRPWLVSEQTNLQASLESGEKKAVMVTLVELMKACVKLEPGNENMIDNLSIIDTEILFIAIRSKAVGDKSDFKLPCSACETYNKVSVSFEEILKKYKDYKVPVGEASNIIEVEGAPEKTSLIMGSIKFSSWSDIISLDDNEKSLSHKSLELAAHCIERIEIGEKILSTSDFSKEELSTWIKTFSVRTYAQVENYITSIERIKTTVNFKCFKCAKDNTFSAHGINDFFQ